MIVNTRQTDKCSLEQNRIKAKLLACEILGSEILPSISMLGCERTGCKFYRCCLLRKLNHTWRNLEAQTHMNEN